MNEKPDRERKLVAQIVKDASPEQTDALRAWAWKLLEIRHSSLPARTKAANAVAATMQSKVIGPMLKGALRRAKNLGWDDRSTAQRLGLGGAAIGVAVFGGQSAGIAALGMGVGVPLWAVLGAGSMFATYLYEELTDAATAANSGVTYTVLDAESDKGPKPPSNTPTGPRVAD